MIENSSKRRPCCACKPARDLNVKVARHAYGIAQEQVLFCTRYPSVCVKSDSIGSCNSFGLMLKWMQRRVPVKLEGCFMKTMVLSVQNDYEIGILAEDKDIEKLSLAVDTVSTTALPPEIWAKLFELSHANVCVNGNKSCAEVEELTAILIKKGALHDNRRILVHCRRDWSYLFSSLAYHS